MFRLSRQLTTALLWLAIALLPLRGGLAVAMPHAMGAGPAQVATELAEAPAADAVSAACDGHASSIHTCSLCSLCHTAAAAVAAAALHLPVLAPGGTPPVHASRDIVGAVFDAPERPPRLLA